MKIKFSFSISVRKDAPLLESREVDIAGTSTERAVEVDEYEPEDRRRIGFGI